MIGRGAWMVFDIDDTLYLERDYVWSGFNAVEAASRLTGLAATCWDLFLAGTRGHIFDRGLALLGAEREGLVEELVAAYRHHHPDIALLADARRCLQRLEEAGHPMACVSDGPLPSQGAKVAALGLARWMDPILLTAALGPGMGKPHPTAFEWVQAAAAPGSSLTYVADNPTKDFAAPRALGWRTIRVRRSGSLWEAEPDRGDVDVEVGSLDELVK